MLRYKSKTLRNINANSIIIYLTARGAAYIDQKDTPTWRPFNILATNFHQTKPSQNLFSFPKRIKTMEC